MSRSFNGRGIIAIFLGISLLFTTASTAATMPGFVRLQPVSTKLTVPTAVAIDTNESIYVTESSKGELHIYAQSGEYIKSLVGLDRPVSVAVDAGGRVYIGNRDAGNVEVYDADLNFLFKLGAGDGEFVQPGSIGIVGNTKILVADTGDDRVKIYNTDGTFDYSIGISGSENGEFNFPTGLAIDETRWELIVTDRQFGTDGYGNQIQGVRIQVFEFNGIFKRSFGTFGVGEGLMQKPVGVAVDGEGRIYVADAMQHVVHVFGSDGTSLGTILDDDNPMRTPLQVVYGDSNRLFVTSMNTGKIEIFGLGSSYTNMSTSPLAVTFSGDEGGANPSHQSVVITNNGTGTISWTAVSDCNWISLSAASGSAAVSGNSTLNIGAGLSGLSAGTYTGHVTISSGTAADIVTINLTVIEIPPLIANAGEPYSAEEDEEVVFNGAYSSGRIALYEWDVDDDGTYEYSSTSLTQSHTYTQDGTYTVRLRVSDTEGSTAEDTETVTISDSSPTADFTADTMYGTGPFAVTYTNNSTGYDQALTYEWDFDGDGITDSTVENPSHTYTVPATYDVALTVTDADGSTDTLTITNLVTVNAGMPGCLVSPVKNGNTLYTEVQNAYNVVSEGETIELQNMEMYDNLSVSRDVTVTMQGGYNCDYTGRTGTTTINGDITIMTGTLILGGIILQ